MNRKVFLGILSIGLFFWNNTLKSQALPKDQIVGVELAVKAFMSAIKEYSYCSNKTEIDRRYMDVIDLQDSLDGTNLLFNDLPNAKANGTITENYDWGEYLMHIDMDFSNEIYVDWQNVTILNCIDKEKDNTYVYASVEKTLTYEGQKMIYNILVAVNLGKTKTDNTKIKEVVSSKLFNKNEKRICDITTDNAEVTNQIFPLRTKAEEYFLKKDYLSAKNTYIEINRVTPNDPAIKNKIVACERLISSSIIYTKAEEQFNNKKYQNAKALYQELLLKQESNNDSIQRKIELCDAGIKDSKFQQQKEMADYYYRVANFEKARILYNNALSYKLNDNYILGQIQKSKNGDQTFVRNELARAVKLAEAGKKNYAEAFRIMVEYELSGLLTTENYTFLTLMMLSKNRDIRKELHYTNDNFNNYLNIYAKKLREKNKMHPTEDATFLLDEVINQRYQK